MKKNKSKLYDSNLSREERRIEEANSLNACSNANAKARANFERIRADVKSEKVNARFRKDDVDALRVIAEKEGIPYQTLLGSVVHKFVTGQLIDVDKAEVLFQKFLKKRGA